LVKRLNMGGSSRSSAKLEESCCHLSCWPLILRRQNLWWVSVAARWTARPSAMSTFGEILAHLGTVIMGVRRIGRSTFCVHFGTPGPHPFGAHQIPHIGVQCTR
jgi:hypothetical protein